MSCAAGYLAAHLSDSYNPLRPHEIESCLIQSYDVSQVPSIALNILLVVRALFCAAANLTTTELMRPARFGYLSDSRDDTFVNPFDLGPVANCLQFWRAPRSPDWGSFYSELMQVLLCSHADICFPCSHAVICLVSLLTS